MKAIVFIFFGMILGTSTLFAQEINQFDEAGKRHGIWKKKYPKSDQLRYEGAFDHGKEIGVFRFYCQECKSQPTSTRSYGKDGTADVHYFTKSGKLVSEGKMKDKDRVGEWVYYHKKSNAVMTREFYKGGKLDGTKMTYYPNGTKTEELNYVMGSKDGPNLYYSPEGVLLKKLSYRNDKLQGEAEYYDANGNVTIKGSYLKGKKHGLWKYFKNGKLELEESYPKPVKKAN